MGRVPAVRAGARRSATSSRRGWGAARRPRGQSLVEFAIVLPILLLLLGGAIDLGRLFYAQVAISNAAKEGALFGSSSPRCDEPKSGCVDPRTASWHVEEEIGGITPVSYTIECLHNGSPVSVTACDEDDLYHVTVEHTFNLVTPLVSALFGSGLDLHADATAVVLNETFDPNATPFPMGTPAATPTPAPGFCTVPRFIGTKANSAANTWSTAGFSGTLTENGNGNFTVAAQSLQAGTSQLCSSPITISDTPLSTPVPTPTPPPTPTPVADPTPTPPPACKVVPDMVTGTVAQARAAWTGAGFTGSFTPANGQTNKTVTSQTTNPASIPGQCIAASASVTVTYQ